MASYSLTTTGSTGRLRAAAQVLRRPVSGDANPLLDGQLSVTIGGHNATGYLLPGLSFSNTNPGGFGEATFRIASTSPSAAFVFAGHTMAKADAVVISHASQTLFEGEITNDVSHAVVEDGFAFYDVTAAGLWWKAGLKGDYCNVWGDDDPGQWFEKNTTGGVYQVSTDGKVEIRHEAGQDAVNGSSKSLYYWLDNGLGDPDVGLAWIFGVIEGRTLDKDSAQWHADLSSSESPWGTWTVEHTWANQTISAGTKFAHVVNGTGHKALRLRLYVDNATSTGTTLDRYFALSRFSVVTSSVREVSITDVSVANPTVVQAIGHGLKTGDRIFITDTDVTPSVNGWQTVTYLNAAQFTLAVNVTAQTTGTGTFFAAPRVDDAMCDIAESTNLAATSTQETDGIGYLNWGLNVRPFASRAEAIETLAANHSDPIDYGFWDSADFNCTIRAAPATVDYIIDATDPGVDFDVYKNGEGTPDAVCVLYKFRDVDAGSSVYPDGTVLSVYRPSAPTWTDAAQVVQVWDQWADLVLTTTQAESIGDQILDWLDDTAYQGTITIASPTVAAGGGGTATTAYIRAGEWLYESGLGSDEKMQISRVEVDVDSGVTTLTIGENASDFVARIDKLLDTPATGKIVVPRRPGRLR